MMCLCVCVFEGGADFVVTENIEMAPSYEIFDSLGGNHVGVGL